MKIIIILLALLPLSLASRDLEVKLWMFLDPNTKNYENFPTNMRFNGKINIPDEITGPEVLLEMHGVLNDDAEVISKLHIEISEESEFWEVEELEFKMSMLIENHEVEYPRGALQGSCRIKLPREVGEVKKMEGEVSNSETTISFAGFSTKLPTPSQPEPEPESNTSSLRQRERRVLFPIL
jgi:hypothetical protein